MSTFAAAGLTTDFFNGILIFSLGLCYDYLWTSLDTISCAVIAGLADTFRERQPFPELQDVLRSELNNKLGEMFRFIDKRLAKEGA